MDAPGRQLIVAPPVPARVVAPAPDAPSLGALFEFMRDAELRFESLRMRLVDETATTSGEHREIVEISIRHPDRAKVVTRSDPLAAMGSSHVWLSDGEVVRTYDARHRTATVRPVRPAVRGLDDPSLPAFSRVYHPRTRLPMETLAEAFVHPNGLCRNVLATADPLVLEGTARIAGRDAYLVRAEHPRRSEVLEDRPDRWLVVGADRQTGLVLLLEEHLGDLLARRAEVTDLELDPPLEDETFVLHVPEDAHRIF